MQELSFFLQPLRQEFDLSYVMPLLSYLHHLPQGATDRSLSGEEDACACRILESMPLPEDHPRLERKLSEFLDPECRPYRTLCAWYAIARAVAYLIEIGE